jgi:hypothetical protein
MFQTTIGEKIETHFVFNNFFFENCAIYEIIWKNCIEPNRPKMTIKYGACALHTGYLGLQIHAQICLSSATMDARTRLSATLYVN